ncbi:hypothetical protein [Pengzhenrongella sicca]|uniref:PH domain-containing protein n=1 Tax=Pengzhenrongella sicca TaxID=2819238 RepID=A0A8A4ZB36_9MICO|nr:hypothetical protein [Pengzhenrongella sicca]QTE28229.1 hypothetical protein J4E96_12615 [Pengzhenrongella sicca]
MAGSGLSDADAAGGPQLPQLLAGHAVAQSQRLPPTLLKVAAVLSVVLCIGVSLSSDVPIVSTAATVESPGYLLYGSVQAASLASLAVVFVAPALGLALAAFGSLAIGLLPYDGAARAWTVAGTLLCVLLVAEVVTRARERAVAHVRRMAPSATVLVPDLPGPLRASLTRVRLGWTAGAAALALVGVGGLILLVHDTLAAAAFRRDSLVADTVVESLTAMQTAMKVTIAGEDYQVPLPSTTPALGQRVEVRYQPRTHRAEATSDVFDPTVAVVPGVGGLLLSVALFATAHRRRHELIALLTEGGLALQARATWSPSEGGVRLFACDDVTRAVATAPSLTAWYDPDDHADTRADWDDEDDPDDDWDDEEDPDDDEWDDDEWDDDGDNGGHVSLEGPATSSLSDAELLELARARTDDDEEGAARDVSADATTDPATWFRTPVVVVGLAHHGAPAAVRDAEGRWYVTRGGIRRPQWRWPRRGQNPRPADEVEPLTVAVLKQRRDAALTRFMQRTGRWMPWAVVPVEWWVLRWMFEDSATYQRISIAVTCTLVGWTWSMYGQVQVVIRPRWLRVRGRLVDELVSWPRITSVVTDGTSLVLRLDSDNDSRGDALLLATGPKAWALMRGQEGPQAAAARITHARAEAAGRGVTPPRVRWRPSIPTLVGLCWLAAALAAMPR